MSLFTSIVIAEISIFMLVVPACFLYFCSPTNRNFYIFFGTLLTVAIAFIVGGFYVRML